MSAMWTDADGPTQQQWGRYLAAYDYLNRELFAGRLPGCILTFGRDSRQMGYFLPDVWKVDGQRHVHEIALHPRLLNEPGTAVLAELVHEMCHLWRQMHTDKPSSPGYHDRLWAAKMREVGLTPSDTGLPGGNPTGKRMSHFIDPEGDFARALDRMPGSCQLPWVLPTAPDPSLRKHSARGKLLYVCSGCDRRAWAKQGVLLICGSCHLDMRTDKAQKSDLATPTQALR